MASFTQTSPVQYKEYVAQNPIEAMTMVGMQREQKLQEGIQIVNNAQSTLEGLDMLRPVDQQYLKANMTALTTGVTKNLSGDFSDSRITSQITGAAKKIYKDPQIQAGIVSTANIRKGLTELDEYRKAGKSSIAQEYVYNDAVRKYTNSVEPGAMFNAKPKQYSDYKKRAVEGLKAMTGNKNIRDDAFIEKDGKLVLNDFTMRHELGGINPQEVQQMLMTYLTPDDFDQIAAEGRYNYSNKSDDQFVSDLQNSYKQKHTVASNYIQALEAQRTKTKDSATIAQIDKAIANENNRLKSIEKEYDNITISGDVESAKAQKATFDFIHGFSNSFAYENKSTTFQGKTPQEMMIWREEFKQKADQWEATFNFNAAKDLRDYEQKERLEKAKLDKANPLINPGGWLLPRDQDNLPIMNQGVVENRIQEEGAFLNQSKNEFFSNARTLLLIPKGKDQEEWYKDQRAAWTLNPNNVDGTVADHFNKVFEAERKVGAMQGALSGIQKEADKQFNINNLIPNRAPIEFYDSKQKFSYSPNDFVTIISKFKKYEKAPKTYVRGEGDPFKKNVKEEKVNWEQAKAELSPKEFFLFEKHYRGDKTINSYVNNYKEAIIDKNDGIIAQKNKFIEDKLKEKFLATQVGQYTIPSTNQEEQRTAGSLIVGFSEVANKFGGNLPNGTEYDEEKARTLAADPKTYYHITTNSGTTFDPAAYTLVASNGKERVVIPMGQEEKRRVLGTAFENVGEMEFDRLYGEALAMGNGITTSVNNKNYIVTKDFPTLQSYGTVGNVIKVGNGYQFDLMVRNPLNNTLNYVKHPRQPVSKEKLMEAKRALNDNILFETMTGNPPTAEEQKALFEAAKKNTTN